MFDLFIGTAHAQSGLIGAGGAGFQTVLMFGLIFGIMYFVVIRPQNRRMQEHAALIAGLKKGDAIVTVGGLHGRVVAVEEKTLSVEIAKTVRVSIDKDKVARLLAAGAAPATDEASK